MKLDQLIGRVASKEFKVYNFSREFKWEIVVFTILKILTMMVSVWAAYEIVYQKSFVFLGNAQIAKIFTFSLLIAIELGVYKSLNTLFKYLLRKHFKNIAFPLIISTLLFTFSFFATINGIALRQYQKENETEKIVKNAKLDKKKTKDRISQEINRLKKEIKNIKNNPGGFTKGAHEPTRLTPEQLNTIKQYNNQISNLREERDTKINKIENRKNNRIKESNREAKLEASEYKKYAIILMIAQLLTNFLLTYSFAQTYKEEDELKVINERINETKQALLSDFFKNFAGEIAQAQAEMQKRLLTSDAQEDTSRADEETQTVFGSINENDEFEDQPTQNNRQNPNPTVQGFKPGNNNTNSKTNSNNSSNTRSNVHSNTRSNTNQQTYSQQIEKKLLGKLKKNDMLRVALKKQAEERAKLHANQTPKWTESRIRQEAQVKRWKIYEYKNLMVSAGLIPENTIK